MSILEESFPDDDTHKELEYSLSQNHHPIFRRKIASAYKTHLFKSHNNEVVSTTTTITPPSTNANTSASSSSDQQNVSAESTNEQPPLEISIKTAPTGLAEVPIEEIDVGDSEKSHFQSNRQSKSTTTVYQGIHNEYTKRRYRHVESKVGQYIASIRAEEQKRRAKFQRHKSMPTSLIAASASSAAAAVVIDKRHSAADIFKLNESIGSVGDDIANSDEHANAMTSSTNTFSSQGGATVGSGGSATSRHESSDEALNGADFIDKLAYAQLVEEKEYIEMRLKEKSNENIRLKRNVDYMRIELSNCQDRLKRLSSTSNSNLSIRSSVMGYSYTGSGCSMDGFGRYASINPSQYEKITATKATQTDYSAVMLRTPLPASLNNSNILRQRSNSNSSAQKLKVPTGNCLRSNLKDIGTTKGQKSRNISNTISSTDDVLPNSSPSPSPTPLKKTRSIRRSNTATDEHQQHKSVRYTPVALLNASDESDDTQAYNENDDSVTDGVTTSQIHRHLNKRRRQHNSNSLRHRFMRLFGRCTRCDDPAQASFDSGPNQNFQMTQSPAPLLNGRDSENVRRNFR